MTEAIKITRVMTKTRKSQGRTIEARETDWLVAISADQKSITIFRDKNGVVTKERTFTVGDAAEYDSYNLSYIGTIEKITDKAVTIWEGTYRGAYAVVSSDGNGTRKKKVTRLTLDMFCWRNYNFDEATKRAENSETSMYI
jgi:hypothetical protein